MKIAPRTVFTSSIHGFNAFELLFPFQSKEPGRPEDQHGDEQQEIDRLLAVGPDEIPEKTSTIPITIPAIMAPTTLPIPPRTTMTNMTRTNSNPTKGCTV